MTAHKHAASMMLYAQDAAETDKPWQRWEAGDDNGHWYSLTDNPIWDETTVYRRKPKTIRIGERDVPAPMTTAPEIGTIYWVANQFGSSLLGDATWDGDTVDCVRLKHGLVHTSKENAIAHAEALILVSGGTL